MTKEEFSALLTEKPEVKGVPAEVLGASGFRVIPEDKYNEFLDTERKTIADAKKLEWASKMEQDIKATSGQEKLPNETHYDYYKRVHGADIQAKKEYADKVKDLEEKIKNNASDPTLKAQLETLQSEKATWEKDKTTFQQQLFEKDVSFEISKGLAGFKAKSDIPEEVVKTYVDTVTASLVKSAKTDDKGQLIYVDANGSTILNKDLKPANAAYILNERLQSIKDTGHQQQGAGTQGQQGRGEADKTLPDNLKSKRELTRTLIKNGVLSGTPEFTKQWNEYLQKHPNLPFD